MAADRSDAEDLLTSWRGTPAFARDRYLTVTAANPLARALSPAFAPGVNLLRHVFLSVEPGWEAEHDALLPVTTILAALLRDSLEEYEEDRAFVDLVGELAARSPRFGVLWGRPDLEVRHLATVSFPATPVGPVEMTYQELRMPLGSGQVIVVWRPADPRSAAAYDRLLRQVG